MQNKLYRAKRKVNGNDWVKGFYYEIGVHCYILEISEEEKGLPFADITVDRDTVCKYTNLPDRNNVEICEKDIVRCDIDDEVYIVEWDEEDAQFVLAQEGFVESFSNISNHSCEVLGNVFDNPEYLTGTPESD